MKKKPQINKKSEEIAENKFKKFISVADGESN